MKSPIAKTQTKAVSQAAGPPMGQIGSRDLELVLALVRGRTLAEGARRLQVDTSTVFRAIQRLEKELRQTLFERRRDGMVPNELALELARRGEAVEAQVEQARELLNADDRPMAGLLRITTTDTILKGLLLPVLPVFVQAHPQVELELVATNQVASLSRRDADIAIRPSMKPPEHLVGAKLGRIASALWASKAYLDANPSYRIPAQMDWAAPDDSLAEHPSAKWRRSKFPGVVPRFRCNSILSIADLVEHGQAIGVAPAFLLQARPGIVNLSGAVDDLGVDLWALTHPDVRHLRRVKAFFDFLRTSIRLDDATA